MPYELVERQVIFEGRKVRLELHHLRSEEGKVHHREVCIHPGAVVILPLLDDDTVVLIANRRYAIDKNLLELPAGTLEKGEIAINGAGRELLEETGYLAQRIKPLGGFYSSPGILSEKLQAFVAYDLEKSTAALEEGEEIQTVTVSLDEAIDMIRTGQIEDAKTIAVLLMYDRFHREKRAAPQHPIEADDAPIKLD